MDKKEAYAIALAQMEFQNELRQWLNERCKEGIKSDDPMERHICGQLVTVWNCLFDKFIMPTLPEKSERHD